MTVRASVAWQLKAGGILLGGAIRGMAQYRADLFMTMAAGAVFQSVGFFALWVMLARFGEIGGWSISDVALLYGIRLVAHAVWALPFNQLRFVEDFVQEGTFDRFLIRPVNPLVQLMTSRFRLHPLGDLLAGLVLLIPAMSLVDVDWNAWRLGFLALAILGGGMVEGAFQLGMSAIAFRTLGTRQARFTVDSVFNLYGNYPGKVFGRAGQLALTILPVAFVAYLPTTVLLGRTDELGLPAWLAYLSPVVGALLFAGSYAFWHRQIRHYQGAGS
ncbi:ABC-2 family transporter protein [Phytomonospora sp. NPDC050363]|uniref:ABC transporter permease n=1 Tax=Phytomonospora sp. NPDC050363 TaxID=3155642 RepID=UPI0033CAE192